MGQEHVAKVGSFIKWTLVTNAGPWMYFHAVVLLIKLMDCKRFTSMVVVSEASHVVEVERSVEEHLLVCVREYPKRIARRRVEIHVERHKPKWGWIVLLDEPVDGVSNVPEQKRGPGIELGAQLLLVHGEISRPELLGMISMIPDKLRQPLCPHIESVDLDCDPVFLLNCLGLSLKRDKPRPLATPNSIAEIARRFSTTACSAAVASPRRYAGRSEISQRTRV